MKQYVVHYGLLVFAARPAVAPTLIWVLVNADIAALLQHGLWVVRPLRR